MPYLKDLQEEKNYQERQAQAALSERDGVIRYHKESIR